MRWIPTQFALWPPGKALSPVWRRAEPAAGWASAENSRMRLLWLVAGLTFASFCSAGEIVEVSALAPPAGHWPWIAATAILGLLGVVSFVSRRRSHAIVGR